MYIPQSVNMAKTTSSTALPRQKRSENLRCPRNAAYSSLSNSSAGASIFSPVLTSGSPRGKVIIAGLTFRTFSSWAALLAFSSSVKVVKGLDGCRILGLSQA